MNWQQICILIGAAGLIVGAGWKWLAPWLQKAKLARVKLSTQTQPPKDLTPAEIEYLLQNGLSGKGLAATLLSLHNRGILRVMRNNNDYVLCLQNLHKPTNTLEKKLLMFIFTGKLHQRALASIHSETTPAFMAKLIEILRGQLNKEHMYKQIPPLRKRGSMLLGFLAIFAGVLIIAGINKIFPGSFPAVFALGGIVGGWLLSRHGQLSQEGLHELALIQAFKRYLTEKSKLNDQKLYYSYLPYAIVLNVERSWSARFDGIASQAEFIKAVEHKFKVA
ncbi:DUF2207 domain-containing protein [Candidatus Saccharibacteria bacterium]|nr:DUF2207 domain-containing protein [Candidatus Saccharibacteria bacterium]